jgi:hypothetical protein
MLKYVNDHYIGFQYMLLPIFAENWGKSVAIIALDPFFAENM